MTLLSETNEVHYIYDGNVVIQERDSNNVVQVSYTRGNDLSGTLQGAGGIGGLLARTDTNGSVFYHADGNGNITCLIDASQNIVAKYLYDPFGNTLSMSGPLASANAYRFSSKEWDANAGLYYYLYRFYDPNLQRWLNRDPIENLGFNLVSARPMSAVELTMDREQRILNAIWEIDPTLADEEEANLLQNQHGNIEFFISPNGAMNEVCFNCYVAINNCPISVSDPFGLFCFKFTKHCKVCIFGKASGPVGPMSKNLFAEYSDPNVANECLNKGDGHPCRHWVWR